MEETQVANSLQTTQKAPGTPAWRHRGFPVVLFTTTALFLTIIAYLPDSILASWRDTVMTFTRILGTLTGLHVANNGDLMSVNGFLMRIVPDCTTIHYIVIITSAILLSSWHTLLYRIGGVAIAIPLLVLFNSIRLLFTGLAGAVSPELFSFVHDYLWVTLFVLLTFGIWVVWDKGRITVSRHTALTLFFCSIAQGVLWLIMDQVGAALTMLAALVMKILPGVNQMDVIWNKGRILFRYGRQSTSLAFSTEILVLSTYLGAATAVIFKNGTGSFQRLLRGFILLITLSAVIIALTGPIVAYKGNNVAELFLWVMQGVMLAFPVAIWRGESISTRQHE